MKPYYEHAGITIYHGDCREILPTLNGFDDVVTDPPYGIGYKPQCWKSFDGTPSEFSSIYGDEERFNPKHLLVYKNILLWGANYFSDQLPIGSWICWDKRCGVKADRMFGSSFELAWFNSPSPSLEIIRVMHGGLLNADSNGRNRFGRCDKRFHPTQKPVAVMVFCLSLVDSDFICDPYCGSGSTLLAAKKLGKSAIGIEIEEKYCEIAAKRLSQEVLPFGTDEVHGLGTQRELHSGDEV